MTRAEIEKIVAWWVPRLGLERWDLCVCWPGDPTGISGVDPLSLDNHQHASTWRSRDYDQARIYFNADQIEDPVRLPAIPLAVDELLHLVTRETEFVLDLLDGQLHRDVDSLVADSHHHAVEGVVDRLAYRLVELVAGLADALAES